MWAGGSVLRLACASCLRVWEFSKQAPGEITIWQDFESNLFFESGRLEIEREVDGQQEFGPGCILVQRCAVVMLGVSVLLEDPSKRPDYFWNTIDDADW